MPPELLEEIFIKEGTVSISVRTRLGNMTRGDYHTGWEKALKAVGYEDLRKEQAERVEAFRRGETRKLSGALGLAILPRLSALAPVKNCDILGLKECSTAVRIRIHPTGSAIAFVLARYHRGKAMPLPLLRIQAEIGIPAEDITLEEGDTDTAPYGLGTYGSRSTPVAVAATAMAGRKIRAKAQMIAAYP